MFTPSGRYTSTPYSQFILSTLAAINSSNSCFLSSILFHFRFRLRRGRYIIYILIYRRSRVIVVQRNGPIQIVTAHLQIHLPLIQIRTRDVAECGK